MTLKNGFEDVNYIELAPWRH